MSEQKPYSEMTDTERHQCLWTFTTEILRLKNKRKILKDEPVNMSANEFKMAVAEIGLEIRGHNAEIKRLMRAARL